MHAIKKIITSVTSACSGSDRENYEVLNFAPVCTSLNNMPFSMVQSTFGQILPNNSKAVLEYFAGVILLFNVVLVVRAK